MYMTLVVYDCDVYVDEFEHLRSKYSRHATHGKYDGRCQNCFNGM